MGEGVSPPVYRTFPVCTRWNVNNDSFSMNLLTGFKTRMNRFVDLEAGTAGVAVGIDSTVVSV